MKLTPAHLFATTLVCDGDELAVKTTTNDDDSGSKSIFIRGTPRFQKLFQFRSQSNERKTINFIGFVPEI